MIRILLLLCCCVVKVSGQQTIADDWQAKLSAFYDVKTPLKLHLFFNQPEYAPGDTAYFRAAFLTAADNMPVEGRQIVTLVVLDETGKVVLSQEFRMDNGWSGNQLIIPDGFNPGVFRIVAYNDWMKNLKSPVFFETTLKIVGPLNQGIVRNNSLQYYAEGGKLITGLNTRVVLYTGKKDRVRLLDSNGGTVAEVVTNDFGLGFFFLKPLPDLTYMLESSTERVALKVEEEGCAILFNASGANQAHHRLIIQKKITSYEDQDLILVISRHNKIYYSSILSFDSSEFIAFNIDPVTFPSGLFQLCVITTTGNTIASRVFFNEGSKQLKPNISFSNENASTREPVRIDFSLADNTDTPQLARISVSVYREDLFRSARNSEQKIDTYLSLQSDLFIDSNKPLLQDVLQANQLDLFLIMHQWPWYTWEEILQPLERPSYNLRDYPVLAGRLVDFESGRPIEQSVNITFYFSGIGKPYTTFTNDEGIFEAFLLFDFFNTENIFYRIEKDGKILKNVAVRISQPAGVHKVLQYQLLTTDSSAYYNYKQRVRKLVDPYRVYYDQKNVSLTQATNPNAITEKLVYGADYEIDIDDYLLFPTMRETLTEVLHFLHYTKVKGEESIYLYRPDNPTAINQPPLIMIDGVIYDECTTFLNLNPAAVDKIKLVQSTKKLERLGGLGRNGFVLVETKNQEKFSARELKQYVKLEGLTQQINFPSGPFAWQADNIRAPQFKSSLYWSAREQLDANGHATFTINTTDDIGRYVVRIEGLTTLGVPFVAEKRFNVSYTP